MHNIIQEVIKWQCKLTLLAQGIAIFAVWDLIFFIENFPKSLLHETAVD